MDSKASENEMSRPLRRSTRQSAVKALSFEPTPRIPLKRTKRHLENQAPVAAVNGSRDKENGSEDEESPSKKSRLETGEAGGGSGDEIEMDVQESAEDEDDNEEQEMDMERQDSSHVTHRHKIFQGASGDVNLFPRVVLRERCSSGHAVNEDAEWIKTKTVKLSTKEPATPSKSAIQSRPLANRHHAPITSMDEYRKKMEDKAKSADKPTVKYHTGSMYPASEKAVTKQQYLNNIKKEIVQKKKQDKGMKKTAKIKTSSGYSCSGFMWHLWCLLLLVLLSSAALLVYKKIPVLQRITDPGGHLLRAVKPETFADQFSLLEAQFPSQRPELWKRSKIHLERHLKTAQPTEPVSLIFTAGSKANKTLRCLAQGLASSFSSALNASVLDINGASKASQDSDDVKLDIDSQLKAAFEGNKPVAVIHHLEELPPGSTLIFYRYCDHESAAYKRVFLLFTVLLPQDEISSDRCLKDVEEMVQDYVKERLVGSSSQTSFNEMDTDKYGGLWSRISHLILPVVSEQEVEQKGC
ncbi:torsin-1A-interacting protein 2-like isoform X1 [Seriola lalandi dorsalis]|uniref:Torsin-1A-interacting protein 2-like n=1 Tax=Seriola lalandi dorsalis TaxID=1841481 RepID=A0A3B4XYS3_SERLL|nr:torsin-1A-interacting protein 2-like isoform X1 [Seriola lalandi dorsalis]XP_056235507.1 torsin-1A-interacting protein 2-like [Seriola aureovittata]